MELFFFFFFFKGLILGEEVEVQQWQPRPSHLGLPLFKASSTICLKDLNNSCLMSFLKLVFNSYNFV